MHATFPRSSMRRQLWRPSGETPSLSRFFGEPPPEAQLLLHITTAARHRMCVWWMFARKQISPSSTSWHWRSFGLLLHLYLTSVPFFCLTGNTSCTYCIVTNARSFHLLKDSWMLDRENYYHIFCYLEPGALSQIHMKIPWGSSVVCHFMLVNKQLYHSMETPSFVPVISLCRTKPTCKNCFCVLHPFSLMGSFAGRLKANGLIE